MAHSFKSNHGQCACRWCGRWRHTHAECIGDDIKERLAAFAAEHGRTWKAALRHLWNTGKDEGLLRQARNALGPGQLDKITPAMLARHAK